MDFYVGVKNVKKTKAVIRYKVKDGMVIHLHDILEV